MKTFIRSLSLLLILTLVVFMSVLGQEPRSNPVIKTNRPEVFQLNKKGEALSLQQKEKGANLGTNIKDGSFSSQQKSNEGTLALKRNINIKGGSLVHPLAIPQSGNSEKQIFTPGKNKSAATLNGLTAIGDPANINSALVAGANYVKHAQSDVTEDNAGNGNPDTDNNDGGWDWVLTLPNVTHSSLPSEKNLYGATGLGLYYGYLRTNNASLMTAMQDAANKMIADASVRDASALKFLMLYNDLPGVVGTAYKDAAKSKYDARIAANGGTATSFAQYIRDKRGITEGYHNGIIGWDLGAWAVAAQMLYDRFGGNYHTDAVDIADVAYNASFVSNANYFDLVRCAGWDPTWLTSDYWWYNLGVSGLIDAFHASGTHTSDIAGLVTKLQNSQASFGGFCGSYGVHTNDDDWQTTAYAIMTLAALNPSSYATEINHGAYYLAATQNANGGWVYSDNTHYPEVGGECTSALYFGSNASTVWVDDNYTSSSCGSHLWGFDAFSTIQNGIDGVASGGTVNVYPGTYVETASNRSPVSIPGTYTFGLYIGRDKNGITVQGVNALGSSITDYHNIVASVQTEATNNFGPDGIFMEGDNVTITGLHIWQDTLLGTNKTISVIGDNFTFKYCHLTDVSSVSPWGSLYIDDEMYDAGLNISHIQRYTIEGNWFDHCSIDPNNGAGYTGAVSGRVIRNNLIDLGAYAGASISFTGSGTPVPWFVHGVGGAVITGNTFLHNAQHIRARGDYNNTQFDWSSYWNNNTFDNAAVVGIAPPSDIREYSYTGGYGPMNHCRRIGGVIQNEISHGQTNDTVKVAPGIYVESITINIGSLKLAGLPGAIIKPSATTTLAGESIVYIDAVDNVTVQGFEIDGTANTGVHYGLYAFNSNNSKTKNNIVHDIHNRPTDDGGCGILFFGWGQGITGSLIDGNTVYNCDRMGIFIGGMETVNYRFIISGGTIQNNTVYNTWQSSPADWGGAIQINAAMNSTISNNTVHDTKIGANYRGIVIDGSAAGNNITGNFVYNNAKGIMIWSDPTTVNGIDLQGNAATSPVVYSNSMYSNTTYGLRTADTNPSLIVNASGNWWGSSDPTTVAGSTGPNVDYTPWLNTSTDTQLGTTGFQGDFSNLWVDDDSPQSGSVGRIQEGIDLVSGSTVNVAAGIYEEQIEIAKAITLQGAGAGFTTIKSPPTLTKSFSTGPNNFPIVYVHDASGVAISNFTVDGFGSGNANYRFIGIGYRNAGGTVSGCTIKDIRNNPIDGAQHGVGLYANADDGNARTLNANNNTIFGFQKNATVFAGANLTVSVSGNTITGAGAVNFIAQNGIQIYGATGSVTGNHVTGFSYTPATWTSTGMLIYNALGSVSVTGNTVSESQVGIYYINSQGTISQDTVSNTLAGMGATPYWWGIVADPGIGKSRLPEVSGVDIGSIAKQGASTNSITALTTTVNNNIMNGGGNGTGIEADALGTETLNFSANQNTVTNWGTGFVLYKDAGATLTSVLRKNSIAGNQYGVLDQTGVLQDARENWWGHSSGPADPKTLPNTPNYNNPSGLGDSASSYIDYKPWYIVGTMDTLSEHTVTASGGSHGTISPVGSIIVAHAKDTTFTFTPDVGYHVDSILVDGVNQGSGLMYMIHNVRTDHTLRVVFALNTYTLNTSVVGSGSVMKNPSQPLYNHGTNVQLTAMPADGYHFVNWSGADVPVGHTTDNPLSLTMDANKTITANFAINIYSITASAGANGSINPSGLLTLPYGSNQTYNFTPDQYYQVDSIIVDGSYLGSAPSYTFTNIAANHAIAVKFCLMPSYLTLYRTFTYEELPVSRPINKKPTTYYWEFMIRNTKTETVTQTNIVFKTDVLTILSSGNLVPVGSRTAWTFYGVLQPNETVIIKGRSNKPFPQQIKRQWFGNLYAPPVITNVDPIFQKPEYPMPNLANVRKEAYQHSAFASTRGLVVGIPKEDSAKFYGWVRMASSNDMFNSLIDRSWLHTGRARGFETFEGGRLFTREQKNLPPRKHNNRLFAELLTLKFNIAISRIGMTEPGLGELRFVENGNPYNLMLVRDIAAKADSLMTFHISDLNVYDKLDSTILKINCAFSGPFDTLSWVDSLTIKGVRNLLAVTYLQPSGIIPERVSPMAIVEPQVPEQFELAQNYPNPFNPSTTMQFTLSNPSMVTLKVYNIVGQEVATLFNNELMYEGTQEVEFQAENFSSGVYFYRLTAKEIIDQEEGLDGKTFESIKKMILLK